MHSNFVVKHIGTQKQALCLNVDSSSLKHTKFSERNCTDRSSCTRIDDSILTLILNDQIEISVYFVFFFCTLHGLIYDYSELFIYHKGYFIFFV